ncbi:MAG: ABC transporter ATP-binding protein [Slackia sp.]|nr:ABC transporter ATP-binding protein [Slackia sp.]
MSLESAANPSENAGRTTDSAAMRHDAEPAARTSDSRSRHTENDATAGSERRDGAASEPLLDVRGLTCGYHRKVIVQDASFSLDQGQFACIIGTNGCGKTTLLKTILGLLPPMGGGACIHGHDIFSLSDAERARHIAYIPQAHTPPFPFSVADVVLMGRTPHIGRFSGVSHEDKRVAWDALCMLGIEHLAERTYTKLSGGQQQLVLIARALTQQPELIVMDEPTASLDFGNQQIVLSRMKELSNNGATVLMVTHDPGHAVYCADTVIVVKDGRVGCKGRPEEVITKSQMESIYQTPIHVSDIMIDGQPRRICVPL